MSDRLPELLDPFAFVDKGRRLNGELPIAKMTRVVDLLAEATGSVRFWLEFGREDRFATIRGEVEAELALECQCCLERMAFPIETELHLGIVRSLDEAGLLPENYEPLLVETETVALIDIIQDEILLAIPTVPQHESCRTDSARPRKREEAEAPPIISEKPNPFSVLAELKRSRPES